MWHSLAKNERVNGEKGRPPNYIYPKKGPLEIEILFRVNVIFHLYRRRLSPDSTSFIGEKINTVRKVC